MFYKAPAQIEYGASFFLYYRSAILLVTLGVQREKTIIAVKYISIFTNPHPQVIL